MANDHEIAYNKLRSIAEGFTGSGSPPIWPQM
jgi:hypothetical protein